MIVRIDGKYYWFKINHFRPYPDEEWEKERTTVFDIPKTETEPPEIIGRYSPETDTIVLNDSTTIVHPFENNHDEIFKKRKKSATKGVCHRDFSTDTKSKGRKPNGFLPLW